MKSCVLYIVKGKKLGMKLHIKYTIFYLKGRKINNDAYQYLLVYIKRNYGRIHKILTVAACLGLGVVWSPQQRRSRVRGRLFTVLFVFLFGSM